MRSASTEGRYRSLRKRARVPGFVLALAVGLVLPGQAAGAVTIGSNLEAAPTNSLCCGTIWQRSLLGSHQAAGGLTSPIDGVVVRWRVRAGTFSGPTAFRVIRPGGDADEVSSAGTSPVKNPLSNTTTSFGLNPGMPVRIGDGVGIVPEPGEEAVYIHVEAGVGELNQEFFDDGDPPHVVGSPFFAPTELLLQAIIEPDKDNDGLGDESQDPDGGNPPPPAPPAKPACLIDLPLLGGNIRVLDNPCIARL